MKKYLRILFCFWLPLFCINLSSLNAQTDPTYYYVSQNGDDSNIGTISFPWKTFAKAASMATANVTVFIMKGTYNERLIPVNSGTAEGPVTFAAYPGDSVIINGVGINFPSGSAGDRWWNGLVHIDGLKYIRISGLRVINSGASGILALQSSFITIENNYTDSTYSPGIKVDQCDNVVVQANEVVHGCTGNDQECISISESNHFEIKNNRIHDGLTEGIDVKVGSSYGIVSKNLVYNQPHPGIYIDAWTSHEFNIEVFDNISHDNGQGFAVASENGGLTEVIRIYHNIAYNNQRGFIVTGWGVNPQVHAFHNIVIFGNESFDNEFGIEIGGFQGTTLDSIEVFNNLIYSNKGAGVRVSQFDSGPFTIRNIAIFNNTIFNNGTAGNGWNADNSGINIFNINPENLLIQNNIISSNYYSTIYFSPEVPAESVTIDYNFFDGFRNVLYENAGTNAVYGTPLFVDPTGNDYHLKAASQAIDKGDPGQRYNDPEDTGNPGNALSPALGTIRNDMGAYGGPFASSWDPKSYASIPPAPTQVFPITNATRVPATLLLGWNGPWEATSSRLQISTSSDFSTTVIDSSGIKGLSGAIMDLSDNTHYYWRVNATNAAGTGSFSGTWSFTTTTITGINYHISDEAIRIYPVPAVDILKIDGIENELTTISILSLEGKLMKQIKGRGIREIDIQGLLQGVHLLKISNSQIVITKKIVKF